MEQLSDDVLLEIFSYLDSSSLKALCDVDESWAELIKQSSCTMRKFSLTITQNGVNIEKKTELEGGRQHSMTIEYIREYPYENDSSRLLDEVLPHKGSVKKLNLYQMGISKYYSLLDGFTNLTHLTLTNARVIQSSVASQNSNRANLINLRHLTVLSGDWKIFKMLRCDLISLKVDTTTMLTESSAREFMSFLINNCASLRTLILKKSAKNIMSEVRLYPFKLLKLSIDNLFDPNMDMTAVIDFLRQQKPTLRELEVKNAPRDLVLRFILAELQLEKLQIGISQLPKELNYFNIIPKNRHLKTLVMRGVLTSISVVEGIVSQYPSEFKCDLFVNVFHCFPSFLDIETLKFFSWHDAHDITDLLVHLSENLRHLRVLRIPSLCGLVSPTIDFRSLKSLHVSKIEDESQAINWKFLTIYSPNIEKLTIERVENCFLSNGNIELVIMKSKQLRELCLGTVFEIDEQLYNIIKTTGKNLKKLVVFTRQTELAKTNATRIHSGGLNCLIIKTDLGQLELDYKQLVEGQEDVIDHSPFNTIENIEQFIHPPSRPPAAQDNVVQINDRMRRRMIDLRRRREIVQVRRSVRQRLEQNILINGMLLLEDSD
jgi:hypothetical protein